jgi:hypothetical protein
MVVPNHGVANKSHVGRKRNLASVLLGLAERIG